MQSATKCMKIIFIFTFLQSVSEISKTDASDPIDTKKYQSYLIKSTVLENRTRKFIVDLLWSGIYQVTNNTQKTNNNCLNNLQNYIQGVIEHKDVWALKMYDASSGNPSGFLTGNIQEIGSYDECVEITEVNFFKGKYCKAMLNDTYSPLQEHYSLKDVPVSYVLCIPSTCSASIIQNILNIGAKSVTSDLSFIITDESCFIRTETPFTIGDWFAILIFIALIGLCVFATAYDIYIQPSSKGKLHGAIVAFSFHKNGHLLLNVVRSRESMDVLYGIRFLTMVWIILIHRFSQLHTAPSMGLFKWNTIIQDWSRAFITNGYICVDTFLVMSGMLLSYTFLKKIDKQQSFNIIQFYLHRYIRLTPALAGLVLFYATVSDRFCEGPQCIPYNNSVKKPCEKNWWATLLYINNYYDSDNMCAIQTWYTSADMQLFWISPLLLYPLMRYRKIMSYLLSGLIAITALISLIQPYLNNVSAGYFIKGKVEDHRIFLENYIYTHTRATSWLIGFALGIYMYNFKQNPRQIPKKIVFFGWILCAIGFFGVIFSILPFQQESHKYDPVFDTLYKSIHRHVWALASCWLIFACATGYGGFLNEFLSWGPVFQPLGRLAYCIYLTHLLILKLQMGAQRTPMNFSDMTRVTIAFGDILASIFSAAVLFLLFEAPGCALDKVILGPENKKKQKKTDNKEKGLELQNERK